MNTNTWRDKFRPMIAKLLEEKFADVKDVRKLRTLLNRECPFCYQASSWMMKVWRDEVSGQIGTKAMRKAEIRRRADVDRGQKFLEMKEHVATQM